MLSPVQLKSSLEAAVQYNKDLNEEAVAFLAGRGISKEVADQYQLGYIKQPFATHENYQGWLSIPYITVLGHCVGFKFRRLDDGKPKYGAPLGQKGHLYNVSDIIVSSSPSQIAIYSLDKMMSLTL